MEILENEYLYLILKNIPAYYSEIIKIERDIIKTTIFKRGSEIFYPSLNYTYSFQQNKLDNVIVFDGKIKNIDKENGYIDIKIIEDSFKHYKARSGLRIPIEIFAQVYFLNGENRIRFIKEGRIVDLSIVGAAIRIEHSEEEIKNGDKIYIEFILDKKYLTALGEIKNIIKDEEGIKIGFVFLHILPDDEMKIMELQRKMESKL